MSNQPPLQPALVCQKCGAVNSPSATACWVCDGQESTNPFAAPPVLLAAPPTTGASGQTPAYSRFESVFAVLLAALFVLTILIGVGIAAQDPGVLVVYFLIVGPTFLAVGTRALYSLAKRERPKASSLFLVFVWSSVITAAILCLLVVSAVVALFVMCASLLGGAR